ncbi:hypothetical protein F383_21062 [Gossypium arboreum]|uniref:Uncharacterized protein n=1 Tax=Gossypium arboreum TaxID=29729 RepID=A0A0B0NZX5_GOSAR|nr:hypothetical protein F383_21062 [Gossypium arboreum]
MSGMCQVT